MVPYKRAFLSPLGSPLSVIFPILTTSSYSSGKIYRVISEETRELPCFVFFWVSVVLWGLWVPRAGSGSPSPLALRGLGCSGGQAWLSKSWLVPKLNVLMLALSCIPHASSLLTPNLLNDGSSPKMPKTCS